MSQPPVTPHDPRAIAKWAERYARSRTLPFLVQWVFIVALVGFIGLLAEVTLYAFRNNHPLMLWICNAVTAITTVLLMWFSISKWGGEQIWRISQWLYGKEGYAAYGGSGGSGGSGGGKARNRKRSWWIPMIGLGLALYHLILTILVGLRHLPVDYIQPFSALYMAPFLAVMIMTQRLGFWAWVWPVLYALHAVAILTGMPHFQGKWFPFDIFVPIFGYGLIAIIVGHCYSRYALRRLKALAREGILDKGTDDE